MSSARERSGGAHAWRAAGVLLSLAILAGCATRADLVQVQQDQREVRALLADQQVAVDGLRRRVEILGEIAEGSGPGGQAPPWLRDLEARLAALERGRVVPTFTDGGGLPEVLQFPTTGGEGSALDLALTREEAALPSGRAGKDFGAALQQIRQGQCTQAVPMLRDFVRKNARSGVADNAQYWIGRCYYGERDYNRAIIELNEVLLKYPKGDKVPAALLLLADAFADSGDSIDARLILQKLISDHPQSEEAAQGRRKLQALGG